MKLHHQSLKYLSISILAIVTLWAVFFYIHMLNEIKSSIDEGLENYKRMSIQNAQKDSTILSKTNFDKNFFTFRPLKKSQALAMRDQYKDTLIHMQDADDEQPEPEPARMLTTACEIQGSYYELKVVNAMVEEDDLINQLLWSVLWLYVILITGIILTNTLVLKKLWKPFYSFLEQLNHFRLGNTKKLPETNSHTREFMDLQNAVKTLLRHSIATFEQQKEFIGNAAHELQTPLAIANSKLELLLEDRELKNTQAEKIAEVFTIFQRLVSLNKALLLLSKIDNKQFFDNQKVSVSERIRKTIREWEELITFKKMNITVSQTRELYINMDPVLVNIIISNLLKNAIFHNREHGTIAINISDTTLNICNTGEQQPLDAEKIFTRFHKSHATTGGTGLGLAIVKAITDLYHLPIAYRFNAGKHCFSIPFTPA